MIISVPSFRTTSSPTASTCKCSCSNRKKPTCRSVDNRESFHHARRNLLKLLSYSLLSSVVIAPKESHSITEVPSEASGSSSENEVKRWKQEDLCGCCKGRGRQECTFCTGTGVLSIDDSVVQQDHECPNCQGAGKILCPACIGLGLADVNGILRNGKQPPISLEYTLLRRLPLQPCFMCIPTNTIVLCFCFKRLQERNTSNAHEWPVRNVGLFCLPVVRYIRS